MNNKVKEYYSSGRRYVIKVLPTDDYSLVLEFDNGEKRIFDMKNELTGVFAVLKNKEKFKSVFIDNGNIAWDIDEKIDSKKVWNNRIDICKDSLYLNSN